MTRLVTAEEMREIERAAMDSGSVTGLELMERAGAGAVEAILTECPKLQAGERRVAVLCGPGNNGGDGFVMARRLAERGWTVDVFLYGNADRLPPDARRNYERYAGPVRPLDNTSVETIPLDLDTPETAPDLVIDAIFGIGLSRPFGDRNIPDRLDRIAGSSGKTQVVALDLPSGWCADSGRWLGEREECHAPSRANLTLAFHAPKHGHFMGDAPQHCGVMRVIDIGLVSDVGLRLVGPPTVRGIGKGGGHKFDHGHALILSGGVGQGGAARMAARAALRVGAGLVTVGCPPAAMIENAAQLTAIMLQSIKDADTLCNLLEDSRLNALALGPGLGKTDRTARLLHTALDARRPTVLDADALTMIAEDQKLRSRVHDLCVLTPHAGEFARLFPDIAERLTTTAAEGPAYGKADAARDAAGQIGATVLLKGPDTVIAHADGTAAVHAAVYDRAAPWLATAGSGDVLGGIIAGLLARRFDPFKAACTAAWLHTEAARAFGPGLIAEDLPEMIPQVLANLGA